MNRNSNAGGFSRIILTNLTELHRIIWHWKLEITVSLLSIFNFRLSQQKSKRRWLLLAAKNHADDVNIVSHKEYCVLFVRLSVQRLRKSDSSMKVKYGMLFFSHQINRSAFLWWKSVAQIHFTQKKTFNIRLLGHQRLFTGHN